MGFLVCVKGRRGEVAVPLIGQLCLSASSCSSYSTRLLFLASWIAHDRSRHGGYFTSRVPKMAIYGAFISAPLGHVLISMLQKLFRGRKSLKAKVLQILVSNLVVSFAMAAPCL